MLGQPIQQWFLIGVAVGFTFGLAVGFYIWSRRNSDRAGEKRLSQLQIVGVALFVVYMGSPLFNLPKPDSMIAIAVLSLVAGENIGVAFAKFLERTPYVSEKGRK